MVAPPPFLLFLFIPCLLFNGLPTFSLIYYYRHLTVFTGTPLLCCARHHSVSPKHPPAAQSKQPLTMFPTGIVSFCKHESRASSCMPGASAHHASRACWAPRTSSGRRWKLPQNPTSSAGC
ncbi:hypothetical protein FB451DRAFT_155365 [Mycena latifolia]|nr:hypothetical protein FB451DRAFT_155365 [Mycena latifolia]